ncbi:MAG: hypothetical protein AAGD07_08020 [Planctomycetota bacterium]
MAKKKSSGVNKSVAIRTYKTENPDAKPKEIQAALAKDGINIATSFISTVLSQAGMTSRGGTKRGRRKTARKPAKQAVTSAKRAASVGTGSSEVSLDSLIRVKKIVEEMGSVENAQNALKALDKLIS